MTAFVGTTGAKVVRALEEVVPGVTPPPRRRRRAPAVGALVAAGSLAAGAASAVRRSAGSKPRQPAATAKQGAKKAVNVTDKTRQELYELARDASIPGRSRMNRRQLAEALSKQRTA